MNEQLWSVCSFVQSCTACSAHLRSRAPYTQLTSTVVHRLLSSIAQSCTACSVHSRSHAPPAQFTRAVVYRRLSSLAQSMRHFIGVYADVSVVSPGPLNGDELIYDRNSRFSSVGRNGVRQIRHKLTTGDGNCAFPALLECERERACDSAFGS